MTLSRYNYREIEKTYENLKKELPSLDRNDLHFNLVHNSSHYYGNSETDLFRKKDLVDGLEKFRKKMPVSLSGVRYLENRYQSLMKKYLETNETPLYCQALSASVFMDPGGDLYPCSIWNNMIGNIRDSDFNLSKLWSGKQALKALEANKLKQCPGCWTPCEAYQSILGRLFPFKS
jgi:MoaA/NifB/PqqE/SkfB family radical SAM enzyme